MSGEDFLDKLLDGVAVEWKPLGDVVTLRRGRVMSKEYLADNSGDYPVYSSQTAKNGEIGRIKTFDFDGEFISWTTDGANAGTVFYRTGKFSTTNVCGLIKINDEKILNYKFLFYWLTTEAQKHVYSGMGNPKLMSHQVEKIPVPIPCPGNPKKSLEIQAKIVRILDAFTELTTELTTELGTRKKQYNHYRDQLLSFEDGEVEWKTIGEVFDLKNGYTPSKANADYWSNGEVSWFRIEDIRTNGRILCSAIQRVSASAVKGKLIATNSLIMSTTATLGEHALIEVPFLTNQQITSFTLSKDYDKKVNVKFMFHYFFIFGKWCSENANKNGGMGIIGLSKLKEFKVPVPSLAEQASIVSILDKFDALTNSLTEGLPREIELRQKQYEHYRDVLLSFPKPQEVVA